MKSFKNHLSLITALFSVLMTLQIFINVERAIEAYEQQLQSNYSIIVIANAAINEAQFQKAHDLVLRSEAIEVEGVLGKLTKEMKQQNVDLLKVALPKFYRVYLDIYPSPDQIDSVSKSIAALPSVAKIESFSQAHDSQYTLLILFKYVVMLFAAAIVIVTTLLIAKEMRIWQFQHLERMNIMALFGAPVWLRSAVLFRLAIVDAIFSSLISIGTFIAIDSQPWIHEQLENLSISMTLFHPLQDGLLLFGVAMGISIFLATMIITGHKEEV